MKLIIDIPEELYKAYEGRPPCLGDEGMDMIAQAIANGTPLPKGHGKLGDLDKIKKEMQNYRDDCAKTSEYTRLGFETAIAVVEDAGTIIEADKDGERG